MVGYGEGHACRAQEHSEHTLVGTQVLKKCRGWLHLQAECDNALKVVLKMKGGAPNWGSHCALMQLLCDLLSPSNSLHSYDDAAVRGFVQIRVQLPRDVQASK